jgi:ribosomal protein S18 acetylase RimI-like enzyme
MAEASTIRRLREDEIDTAAATLTRAFWSSPVVGLLAPDLDRRAEISRWLFGGAIRSGLRDGEVWVAADPGGTLQGAAIWFLSDPAHPTAVSAADAGQTNETRIFGPEGWTNLQEVRRYTAELHRQIAPDRHRYLSLLGVDPDHQGRGVAWRVLAPILDGLDAERLPAFLDTGQPGNVSYYRRFGFEVAGETVLPSSGLVFWGMRRDPH